MITAAPPVRSVAAIDDERTDVEEKRAVFEKRVEPDKETARQAREQRREAVIAYQVDGDTKAGKQLEALTQRSDAADRTERDNADCIEELTKRLRSLAGERKVGLRAETQAALTRARQCPAGGERGTRSASGGSCAEGRRPLARRRHGSLPARG